jgi:hypothetical protein
MPRARTPTEPPTCITPKAQTLTPASPATPPTPAPQQTRTLQPPRHAPASPLQAESAALTKAADSARRSHKGGALPYQIDGGVSRAHSSRAPTHASIDFTHTKAGRLKKPIHNQKRLAASAHRSRPASWWAAGCGGGATCASHSRVRPVPPLPRLGLAAQAGWPPPAATVPRVMASRRVFWQEGGQAGRGGMHPGPGTSPLTCNVLDGRASRSAVQSCTNSSKSRSFLSMTS